MRPNRSNKVKVELPLQLPSRLKSLQKACLAAVFAANPAACPPESRIGYAVVHTPLVPVPLEGPTIFVSHGGEESEGEEGEAEEGREEKVGSS
jgi:hypothetical protein